MVERLVRTHNKLMEFLERRNFQGLNTYIKSGKRGVLLTHNGNFLSLSV